MLGKILQVSLGTSWYPQNLGGFLCRVWCRICSGQLVDHRRESEILESLREQQPLGNKLSSWINVESMANQCGKPFWINDNQCMLKMLHLLLGLSFLGSLDLNRGMASVDCISVKWAIPNCGRHPTAVKDAHGTELATFQAECYGLHLLRVLVEATRLQLVWVEWTTWKLLHGICGCDCVTEETVPETLPKTMPLLGGCKGFHVVFQMTESGCVGIVRIDLSQGMPRLHFTDPEWEVVRFTKVYPWPQRVWPHSRSFSCQLAFFFCHDRTNCKAVQHISSGLKWKEIATAQLTAVWRLWS